MAWSVEQHKFTVAGLQGKAKKRIPSPVSYSEPQGTIKSIAISNEGIIIIGYELSFSDDSSAGAGIIKIFDVSNLATPISQRPWIHQYGNGVDITPDATFVAIGSPNERTVYTYSLSRSGVLSQQRKVRGVAVETDTRFGWKVALSDDGQSLAVAAPFVVRDGKQVGAIYVYSSVYNAWTLSADTLYGRDNMRKIGLGGIAISNIRGRVDARENDSIYSFEVSFQFLDLSTQRFFFHI